MSSEKESESRKLGSEEISREFKTLVNSSDLHYLNHLQHTILGRLQDSNAVLSHFNDFSQHCFAEISGDIARNTRDWLTPLPRINRHSKDSGSLVDHFYKLSNFTASDVTQSIVFDSDPAFINHLLRELFQHCGTKLCMNSAYHDSSFTLRTSSCLEGWIIGAMSLDLSRIFSKLTKIPNETLQG
ncbi:hypothetical protein ACSQ67_004510 [Phaseolus vulgaris]